jgi:anti-anti-sigma factor
VSGSQLLGLATHWWPNGQVVVEVGGELDAAHAHQVFDEIARLDLHPGQRLDLQLENVTFLDSVGASVLVASEELTTRRGCAFHVSSTSLQCRAVLELVGLTRLLPTLDDPPEAHSGMLLIT